MHSGQLTGTLGNKRRAQRFFADAVLAFSDDPGPANLERYLAASRALEESRRARRKRQRGRPRIGGAGAAVARDATGLPS
jgi:hypothetical protein